MNELVQLVSQKTGLPPAQAKQAAETVIRFLKERLPAPVASQLDGVLTGEMGGGLGGLAKGLGGMLGEK